MIVDFDQKKHLQSVVDLHYKELSWAPNSRLGKEHIFNLYKIITSHPSSSGFVFEDNGKVVGFSLVSLDTIEMRNALEECFNQKVILQLMRLSVHDPGILINAIESKFFIAAYLKKIAIKAEWIAWMVDREHPLSRRAAIECFFKTKEFFRANNHPVFVAQTDKRSKESNPFISMMKNVTIKKFFHNTIYIIRS